MTKRNLLVTAAALVCAAVAALVPGTALASAPPGAVDGSFAYGGGAQTDFGGTSDETYAVAVQADGKIVAAGQSANRIALARYDGNGSLDSSFGAGGKVVTAVGSYATASAVAIQRDGKIVVAGTARDGSGRLDFVVARYAADGSLDPSFGAGGIVTTVVAGQWDEANALAIQPDGKLVAAGESFLGAPNGVADCRFALARYNPDGTLDASFGSGGAVAAGSGCSIARGLVVEPDGKLAVAGNVQPPAHPIDLAVARFTASGALDGSFGVGGVATIDVSGNDQGYGLALQSDGKLVAAGWTNWLSGTTNSLAALVRFDPDGSLDSTFGNGGKVTTDFGRPPYGNTNHFDAVTIQRDGKIVAVGGTWQGYRNSWPWGMYDNQFALARYNPDGSLDQEFGDGGKVTTDLGGIFENATAVALQTDGKVLVGGWTTDSAGDNYDFDVLRYDAGASDTAPPAIADVATTPAVFAVGTAVAVHAVADDSASGGSAIASAAVSTDGGATWRPMSAADGAFDSATEALTATVGPFSEAGTLGLCVRATDAAGNTAAPDCADVPAYASLAPTTTASLSGPHVDLGGTTYVGPATTVVLDAAPAAPLSGELVQTHYRVYRAGADAPAFATYGGAFTLPADGAYRVDFYSDDADGNTEATQSLELTRDSVAPQTSRTLDGPTATRDGVTFAAPQTTIALQAALDSPVEGLGTKTFVRVSPASDFTAYAGPFALPASDGAYDVDYYSVDALGNAEAPQSLRLTRDGTAPAISVAAPTAAAYEHSATLTLAFAADDGAGSGLASVAATLDGKPVSAGLSLALLTALPLGSHTLTVTAADAVGNGATQSVVFTVVATAASIQADVPQLIASGDVAQNRGTSLLAKLDAAAKAVAAGDCAGAAAAYGAFENEVRAQTGKSIAAGAASILDGDAEYLIGHCA